MRFALLFLPVGTFLVLARLFRGAAERAGLPAPRRQGLLSASVATATIATILAELSSLAGLLDLPSLALAWLFPFVAAIGAWWAQPGVPSSPRPDVEPQTWILLGGTGIALATTGVVAWFAPPNTWDSMTYHMSRVVHWVQSTSLDHYPTHIGRQILYTPGAEILLVPLQLGAAGDRLANALQWAALLGSCVAASLIARQLGASARGQAFAALFCATTPMAILQASSTQNDLVTSLWLLAVASYALSWRREPGPWLAAGLGAALGLAVLTKITAYVLALPWVVWLVIDAWRRRPQGLRWALITISIGLALNVGHLGRHAVLLARVFAGEASPPLAAATAEDGETPDRAEAPRAPQPNESPSVRDDLIALASRHRGNLRYVNETMTPFLLLSNVGRNLALHAGVPIDGANGILEKLVGGSHRLVGLDPKDPRTTYPRGTPFRAPGSSRHEDHAPNALQLVLILACGFLALLRRGDRDRPAALLLGVVGVQLVLFCVVFKWQPWHSRLHLPMFLTAAPAVAALLDGSRRGHRGLAVLGALLLASSVPWLVANQSRPLLGPESALRTPRNLQYFANRRELASSYLETARFLRSRSCRRLGLVIGGNDWEYPLWPLLEDEEETFRIRHVRVRNPTRHAGAETSLEGEPCAIVAVAQPSQDVIPYDGRDFRRVWHRESLQVFEP